ncbi:hypothetical protein FE810_15100 [Thalassotalea litorea]|uniref:Uncharacterized protein n=1 Tax=Thalassotalea litorea TaxID=2020715 RepID=A0A5R9ICM4_9GAMM|nr:hypothetical protein [Thalassotalea litorea]TLU61336.1 hypothetical protein FE810_15100 [Thalassotalea litorea]
MDDELSRDITIHDISTFNTSMYLSSRTMDGSKGGFARDDELCRDIAFHDISTFNTSMYLVEILPP